MKTICFFEGDMSRGGGTERITSVIANELYNTGKYKVFIISLYNNDNSSYFELNDDIEHISLNSQPIDGKIKIAKCILRLREILKKNNVDILINVDVMLGIFSMPAISFTKIKLISWEHFNYLDDIGSIHTRYLRKFALMFSQKYIVLTKQDEEKFKKHIKKNNKVIQIYNTCIFDEKYAKYQSNSKIIMSAGNMYKVKGFDMAIEVGKKVFTKYPDWKWYIYGDGIETEKIKDKIKEYELENNIFIKSRTHEIEKAYRESSIFVLTSRMESFGLVLLEAQSNNIPVVSFNMPSGPSEIIDNNINGFLIEEFDIDDMAKKISELIASEQLRKEFSKAAKKNIQKFDINKVVLQWQQILDSL